MNKALLDSGQDISAARKAATRPKRLDWRRKMSDHIAYGLLAYTGLQIFVTMGALKNTSGSILPYFALIVLVAAIIPGCRMLERRWEALDDDSAADPVHAPQFKRDRLLVWLAAVGLPFLLTGLYKGVALVV